MQWFKHYLHYCTASSIHFHQLPLLPQPSQNQVRWPMGKISKSWCILVLWSFGGKKTLFPNLPKNRCFGLWAKSPNLGAF